MIYKIYWQIFFLGRLEAKALVVFPCVAPKMYFTKRYLQLIINKIKFYILNFCNRCWNFLTNIRYNKIFLSHTIKIIFYKLNQFAIFLKIENFNFNSTCITNKTMFLVPNNNILLLRESFSLISFDWNCFFVCVCREQPFAVKYITEMKQ